MQVRSKVQIGNNQIRSPRCYAYVKETVKHLRLEAIGAEIDFGSFPQQNYLKEHF